MTWSLSIAVALSGFAAYALHGSEVAKVGDHVIDDSALRAAVARSGLPLNDAATPRKALDEIVTFEILAAEARNLGYDRLPDIEQELKRLLVQRLVLEKVDRALPADQLSDAELREYLQAHAGEFKIPGMIRARVLTLNAPQGSLESRNRLEKIRQEVAAGSKFEDVVRRASDFAREKADGGDTGWLVEGQESRRYPVELLKALFGLRKPGEITGVVATAQAVFLGELVEQRPGSVPSFESIRDQVEQRVRAFRRRAAYQTLVDGLRAKVGVKVDEAAVAALGESLRSNAQPPPAPFRAP